MPTQKKSVVSPASAKNEKLLAPLLPAGTVRDELHAARFGRLCAEAMRSRRASGEGGIGTLREKRLHAIIKNDLCADGSCHEKPIDATRFVADVCIGNEIYEVQTGSFLPMRKKIAYYLEKTDYTVTVVHPIPLIRWISWIDPVTDELSPRSRAPRRARAEDLLAELYALLPSFPNPRLRFRLLFLEVHDFRVLNAGARDPKRGAERYERIPLALLGELELRTPEDFRCLLPSQLPEHFTARTFATHSGLRGRDAYSAVRVLTALGLLTPAEPIGRSMAWQPAKTQKTDGTA